ncbi:DUF433 domain-containing protein [Saccharothrix luteola]|uniref:DUF433 domain-containing protein n=1 Tax=Saccharothrix luteola TaxID=2893018 RepID=UPI001E3657A1|nr:DUF433 domain-containing protein [Saccharothrix luteola]MCC8247876.1 DUF433 domain-containing protein [Saccharothrix luteola]
MRGEFGTAYALATKKIVTDGVDIFLDYADGDLARVGRAGVEQNKVPVDAIVEMWLAGDSPKDVGYEYDLDPEQVEAICRAAQRVPA